MDPTARWWAALRWVIVSFLAPTTFVLLVMAPVSGLLTLPVAMITGGFTVWLVQDAFGVPHTRSVPRLIVGGAALLAAMVVVLLVRRA